jgi:biofilm PGA synthesis N-glycosyltransferase PgaC
MNILLTAFYALSLIVISIGSVALAYYPLAILFELRPRRMPVFENPSPMVSIIVPAYNEEKVVSNCIESILASEYSNFEVILVNDGSKDGTLAAMLRFKNHPRVKVIDKPNGGKASALNLGFRRSIGELLFFVDADGLFTPTTIREMLFGFRNEKVGAVCGNDAPANLDRPLTQLFAIQTHVGTGFVRRALAELNCLPIVSGNIGAFRRSALEKTFVLDESNSIPGDLTMLWEKRRSGPFREGFIGEDLELTWRIHRAGYRVNFAPCAVVLAETPSTIQGLWKQRVRWARGLLQTIHLHGDMFFNPKYGALGMYLPINFFNMVIIPIVELLLLFLAILLVSIGFDPVSTNLLGFLMWLGLAGALLTVLFSIALDRAWGDLKYFYVIPLWIPYSLLINAVMVWAIILEILGKEAKWNKLDRTGVVSRRSMSGESGKKG